MSKLDTGRLYVGVAIISLSAPRHPVPLQASPVEPCSEMIGLTVQFSGGVQAMEGLDCTEGFLGVLVDPSGEGGGGELGVEVAQGRQQSLGQEHMRVALSRGDGQIRREPGDGGFRRGQVGEGLIVGRHNGPVGVQVCDTGDGQAVFLLEGGHGPGGGGTEDAVRDQAGVVRIQKGQGAEHQLETPNGGV